MNQWPNDLYVLDGSLTAAGMGQGMDARSVSALVSDLSEDGAAGTPRVFHHSRDAAPGETFFVTGEGFDDQTKVIAVGRRSQSTSGEQYEFATRLQSEGLLAITVPCSAYDGPFLVRVCNAHGASAPFVINAPEIWWVCPDRTRAGQVVRVFGRNLSVRPDYGRSDVYLWSGDPSERVRRLDSTSGGKYVTLAQIPQDIHSGKYYLSVHSGDKSVFGWSAPAVLFILPPEDNLEIEVDPDVCELGTLVGDYRNVGDGKQVTIRIPEGDYRLSSTLEIPPGVRLVGAGKDSTRLRLDALSGDGPSDKNALDPHTCVVWLSGDGAGISDLSIYGNGSVNLGIAVGSKNARHWVSDCVVERVRISDVDGKQARRDGLMYVGSELPENSGIRLFNTCHARIADNDVCGRVPIYLSGVRQTQILRNRLVANTRWGGNGEGAIEGRNDIVEESVIEGNALASPPGREFGGPQVRRLIWLSTGRGSVSNNWISANGDVDSRYGGVAGSDQNVGEAVLLESQQRVAFYGAPESASIDSITLPSTVPVTPDNRLRHVRRTDLAYDDQAREAPFLPPNEADGREAPIDQYYVTVVSGRGMGQTVRVVARDGHRLALADPWREVPDDTSLVVVSTLFYHNLIVGNTVANAMAGIQLWIGCVDNVVASNKLKRQRRQGIFVLGCASTEASSMPPNYNRGIGPSNWNHIEGNSIEDALDGVLISARDLVQVDWHSTVGNTVRHNSVVEARRDGIAIDAGKSCGSVVEYNLVRDAKVCYRFSDAAEVSVLLRNHAYCWRIPCSDNGVAGAIQVRQDGSGVLMQENEVEDEAGRSI